MQNVRRIFFYTNDNEQPFGHEDLLDEEQEEQLPGMQDDSPAGEPEAQQRWMAPSLFGSVFNQPQSGSSQQPAAEMVDEIARRGGRPLAAAQQLPAVRKDINLPFQQSSLDATGTFEKRSPWWVEGWRGRSFLLKEGKLLYFPKDHRDRPLGVLDFSLTRYDVHCCWAEEEAAEEEQRRACDVCTPGTPENFGTFFLKPQDYPHKVFAFRGPLEEMKLLAAKVAGIVRKQQEASIKQLCEAAVSSSNFWRFGYIREADFKDRAECGDILLFRGVGNRCQLIRCVTTGKYDHVALLLKTQTDNLFVLESTGSDGVSLIPWKNFVAWGWHKCYERIAFRKVYFGRDGVQMEKLQQYVYSILGANYSLTYDKIFNKKHSFSFDERGYENTPESMRESAGGSQQPGSFYDDAAPGPETFFCSELVAACLKRCGVLAGTRASATYWPCNFSQYDSQSLPLHEGVHIGGDEVIEFN